MDYYKKKLKKKYISVSLLKKRRHCRQTTAKTDAMPIRPVYKKCRHGRQKGSKTELKTTNKQGYGRKKGSLQNVYKSTKKRR